MMFISHKTWTLPLWIIRYCTLDITLDIPLFKMISLHCFTAVLSLCSFLFLGIIL